MENQGGDETHRITYTVAADPEDTEDSDPTGSILPASSRIGTPYRSVRVFQFSCDDDHCIHIMNELRHPNILRLESIVYSTSENSMHTLLVQPYEGDLRTYMDLRLINKKVEFEEILRSLQRILRQVINGMAYLVDHDLYHAGFTLQGTYYCIEKGEPVIKLANFKRWQLPGEWGKRSFIWSEDWFSVGHGIDELCDMAVDHRKNAVKPFLAELRELARVLKSRDIGGEKMKDVALEQVFFWSPEQRAATFTYQVPRLLSDRMFYNRACNTFKCPAGFTWDDNSFFGLVKLMNAYRSTNHKSKYIGKKKIHYLKFVCGCYTHENELKIRYRMTMTMDGIFRQCDPEMCLNLMKVVKGWKAEDQKGPK